METSNKTQQNTHNQVTIGDGYQLAESRSRKPQRRQRCLTALALLSIVLTNVGFWSCEDSPQDLGDQLINHFQITTKEVGSLYSISYLTTILIAPVTGVLLNKYGVANIGMIFTLILTIGTFIMYLSVRTGQFWLLLVGRFVFALGAESTLISQATASEKWFSGNILSLAMGLNLSVGIGASSLANFINPVNLVKTRNLETAFLYYVAAATLSFFAMSCFALIDLELESINSSSKGVEDLVELKMNKVREIQYEEEAESYEYTMNVEKKEKNHKYVKKEDIQSTRLQDTPTPTSSRSNSNDDKEQDHSEANKPTGKKPLENTPKPPNPKPNPTRVKNQRRAPNVTLSRISEVEGHKIWRSSFMASNKTSRIENLRRSLDKATPEYNFKLRDITKMGTLFWCVVGIYTLAANSYYQLTFFATNLAVHRFNYSYLQAKNVLSIIQIISAIFMPINSIIILKIGKKSKLILMAVSLLFLSYLNLILTPNSPSPRFEVSIGLITVFYILYQSSIYPCLALSIPREVVSIGFGIASLIQAVPLSSLSYLIGLTLKEETEAEFQRSLYILLGLTFASLLLVLFTISVDNRIGGLLDAPENSKQAEIAKERIERRFHLRVAGGKVGKEEGSKKSLFGALSVGTIKARTEYSNAIGSRMSGLKVEQEDENGLN